ncbi:hypothetical protein GH789_14340 [Rhizobium pusense]|uniref:hypothetical protein n=1 Tax=Agrobacterium pusense TaxID=648995 RepID=UPI00129A7943|nr:hypothetical protein [Agrobacterium pusense]MRG66453.1 hypothetical protein [Agrobacterium pusense]
MNNNNIEEWVLSNFMRKAWFDISQSDEKNVSQANDYIIRNAFLITVQIRSIGVSHDITDAQRRLDRAFGQYHASQLRRHCFTGGKVTRRNKKFQPMAFLAFDIEGSRQNGFHTDTIYPHGHGAALFHEKTLENFKDRHHQFLTPEGGYKIPNPTASISLVDFKPVNSVDDLRSYLRYSLKIVGHLTNNETNYAPYDFYPGSSVDFPFWNRSREITSWDAQ